VNIENVNDEYVVIKFTKNELIILNNALNGVCNGLFLADEFETRMGVSLDEARILLDGINLAT
jgi:hypothetical protein